MTVLELLRRARAHHALGRFVRFRPLALALALVLVLATATATAEAPTGSVIYSRLKAQDVRLSLPPTDNPKGIAIYFHGQNGGVDNRMDEPWLQALLRSGWVIASSDFHTDSWGNAASTEDTQELVDWAEKETGDVPIRLFISGSMGASVSLNAMTLGRVTPPPCWYGVKPAIDLTKMDNVPGARRIIKEAFGGSVPYDRNPVNNLDLLPTNTRYRLVASPQDTWVRESQNAERLASELEDRGADVSFLTVHGTHDDPSHFDAEDLVAFASSCSASSDETAKADSTRSASSETSGN